MTRFGCVGSSYGSIVECQGIAHGFGVYGEVIADGRRHAGGTDAIGDENRARTITCKSTDRQRRPILGTRVNT